MKSILAAVLCTLSLSAAAYAQAPSGTMARQSPADLAMQNILRDLVVSHPEALVRTNLNARIVNGDVYISFYSDRLPPETAVELVSVQGRLLPVLVINPQFITRSTTFNLTEDRKYKQLVIRHEAEHLENHFNGLAPILMPATTARQAASDAPTFWRAEFLATKSEWNLAKTMKAEHLMPAIRDAVAKYGEARGFLEGFYAMLKAQGPTHTTFGNIMLPIWESIYREELRKLKVHARMALPGLGDFTSAQAFRLPQIALT